MKFVRTLILVLCTSVMAMNAQSLSFPVETINGKPYYRYVVEKGIGLYRLSLNFNVSQEQILEANPKLRKTGLQYGATILIPVAQTEMEKVTADTVAVVEDTTTVDTIEVIELPIYSTQVVDTPEVPVMAEMPKIAAVTEVLLDQDSILPDTTQRDTIRLAIMLPLQAVAAKRTANMERFVDFYLGALIAIYEAQQAGTYMEIHTYDVGKQTTIESVISSDKWTAVDAIIGPAYRQQIAQVSTIAQEQGAWMMVPFFSDVDATYKNPRLLQFNPSSKTEAEVFAQYVADHAESVNCVVIQPRAGEAVPTSVKLVHEALTKHEVPMTTTTIRDILTDSLSNALVADKENIIIFNTEKYANLNLLIPHLQKCMKNYKIRLYSRYSWQQDEVDLPQIYTSIFRDQVTSPMEYKQIYQRYFDSKPLAQYPRYDLLGYDLTKHLIAILQAESDASVEEIWNGAQSVIQYQPSSTHAGYENQQISVIRK